VLLTFHDQFVKILVKIIFKRFKFLISIVLHESQTFFLKIPEITFEAKKSSFNVGART